MKKILISEEEKKNIIESHNTYREVLMGHLFDKSLIEEQAQNPRNEGEVIDMAIQKCTQLPTKTKAKFNNRPALFFKPNEKSVDKVSGAVKWDAGDNVYFLGDMSWVSTFKDEEGKERQRYVGRWSCKDLNVEAANLEMMKNQYVQKFGWKQYNTLSDEDKAEVQKNPAAYEIMYLATNPRTQLVRDKRKQQRGAVGENQTSKINSYFQQQGLTGVEWKYEKDLTIPQREEWGKPIILGPPMFDENIAIYMNPEQRGAKALTADIKRQREAQSLSENECSGQIKQYYLTWKEGTEISFAKLDSLKKNVKKCMRLGYDYKAAGLLGGGNVRKMIAAMYGRPTNDTQVPTFDFYGGADSQFSTVRDITDSNGNKLYSFDFNLSK